MNLNVKPNYKHDCNECIFLGHHTEHGKPVDLYFHEYEPTGYITFIGRYSSEGSDYASKPLYNYKDRGVS